MNLNHLTDEALHLEIGKILSQERRLLSTLIHYLRENYNRRLYSFYKCDSLENYLVYLFGMSEDQAWRRVDAIKLLEELPELEEKINQGAHCLTNLNLAHALFKKEAEFGAEPFSKKEKLDILEFIEGLPTRQVKKILLAYSSVPHEMVKDRVHELSLDLIKNNEEIQNKIKRIQGLLAHSRPGIGIIEVLNELCDLGIKHWDKAQSKPIKKAVPVKKEVRVKKISAAPREIRQKIKRFVWQRAQSQCENCSSYFALQIEHIHPKAHGGSDDPENLKLLCRSCNQRTAIEIFGQGKMQNYLSKL